MTVSIVLNPAARVFQAGGKLHGTDLNKVVMTFGLSKDINGYVMVNSNMEHHEDRPNSAWGLNVSINPVEMENSKWEFFRTSPTAQRLEYQRWTDEICGNGYNANHRNTCN